MGPDAVGQDRAVQGGIEEVALLPVSVPALRDGENMAVLAADEGQEAGGLALEPSGYLRRGPEVFGFFVGEGEGQVWTDNLDGEQGVLGVDDVVKVEKWE